jgi:hypothetical protein
VRSPPKIPNVTQEVNVMKDLWIKLKANTTYGLALKIVQVRQTMLMTAASVLAFLRVMSAKINLL